MADQWDQPIKGKTHLNAKFPTKLLKRSHLANRAWNKRNKEINKNLRNKRKHPRHTSKAKFTSAYKKGDRINKNARLPKIRRR